MNFVLSLRERFLLESWLPEESKLGELQNDARSLVASSQTLRPGEVVDRLSKLRRCVADLETSRSVLTLNPPLGRGFSFRHPGGTVISRLSPWERAWLIVDHLRSAGGAMTARALQDVLEEPLLNALAVAVLCLESPTDARRLVTTIAAEEGHTLVEQAWLSWLSGDASIELRLTDALIGETPHKALLAALEQRWTAVEALLPKSLRKPWPKPIRPSGTRMHGQLLAQLASHALRDEPARDVIDASLSALFGFWGFDQQADWWNGREVVTRLPLLALYGRHFEPRVSGVELLHARRAANEHLRQPPPKSFSGPPEVLGALKRLEQALAAAAQSGAVLEIALTNDGNVYTIAPSSR